MQEAVDEPATPFRRCAPIYRRSARSVISKFQAVGHSDHPLHDRVGPYGRRGARGSRHEVTRKLLAVQGVGKVARVGGVTREVPSSWIRRECCIWLPGGRRVASIAAGATISFGRPRRYRRAEQRFVRSAPCSQRGLARIEIALQGGSGSRGVRLDQVATVTDTNCRAPLSGTA